MSTTFLCRVFFHSAVYWSVSQCHLHLPERRYAEVSFFIANLQLLSTDQHCTLNDETEVNVASGLELQSNSIGICYIRREFMNSGFNGREYVADNVNTDAVSARYSCLFIAHERWDLCMQRFGLFLSSNAAAVCVISYQTFAAVFFEGRQQQTSDI